MKRLILVIVTAAAWLVFPSSCRQLTDLPRKWLSSGGAGARPTQAPLYLDPCHKERSMKMICHCEHQTRIAHHQQQRQRDDESIRAAECWILKNDLTPHDPLWRSFDKYAKISELKFIVQSGSLTFLPTEVIKKLINLSELSVSFSNINAIESFAFANSSALQIIRLNNNNITRIEKYAFANHNSLERLDLQENELQEIDGQSFANLSRLEYLALNNNKISQLHNGTFSALNNLMELQLQHNWIHKIRPDMFHRLENLRVLKLSSNKLRTIGNAAFIELWSLQELYLDGNSIEKILERAFDGLNNLRKLSLQRNRLTVLEKAVFTSMPVLDFLNLSDNRLTSSHHITFISILDNFLKNESNLALTGNNLVCDCALNWLREFRNRTRSVDTQNSLDRLECLLPDLNNIPEENHHSPIHVTNKWISNSEDGGDYISDDGVVTDTAKVHGVDLQSGAIVNLLTLDRLPCANEDGSDPTSYPMLRESTGILGNSAGSLQIGTIMIILSNCVRTFVC